MNAVCLNYTLEFIKIKPEYGIKRLQPQNKRLEKFEGGGGGILVYPTGTKSWIYRYKIDNKKDFIIVGHYPYPADTS